MKHRFLLVVILVLLTTCVQAQEKTQSAEKQQEITIRNVTNEVVEYIIQAEGSKGGPMRRSIKAKPGKTVEKEA